MTQTSLFDKAQMNIVVAQNHSLIRQLSVRRDSVRRDDSSVLNDENDLHWSLNT